MDSYMYFRAHNWALYLWRYPVYPSLNTITLTVVQTSPNAVTFDLLTGVSGNVIYTQQVQWTFFVSLTHFLVEAYTEIPDQIFFFRQSPWKYTIRNNHTTRNIERKANSTHTNCFG